MCIIPVFTKLFSYGKIAIAKENRPDDGNKLNLKLTTKKGRAKAQET